MATKHIALLATGDEIVDGVILNTNAQAMANLLFHEQMHVSQHSIVRDNEAHIAQIILLLLKDNDALIITGGLGPTTDDRTRFAVATALQQPLELHAEIWQAITARFKQRYGLTDIPISNQQQALFPKGAQLIENLNGTAAGCLCWLQEKLIFMLPGPPHECLPMFTQFILPTLSAANFGQETFFKNWLLFGVSESHIAEKLEAALAPLTACRTGYRVTFPYLEFKLFSPLADVLQKSIHAISHIITPYLFTDATTKASESLKKQLKQHSYALAITDMATGGWLEQLLHTPELHQQLQFNPKTVKKNSWQLTLSGLDDYWNATAKAQQVSLQLELKSPSGKTYQEKKIFLNYQQRNPHYAAEYACHFLLNFLQKTPE